MSCQDLIIVIICLNVSYLNDYKLNIQKAYRVERWISSIHQWEEKDRGIRGALDFSSTLHEQSFVVTKKKIPRLRGTLSVHTNHTDVERRGTNQNFPGNFLCIVCSWYLRDSPLPCFLSQPLLLSDTKTSLIRL